MSIVDVETYQLLSKDTTTDESDVESMLDFAEAVIGEKLGRELASEERTERLPVYADDVVYPRHTPVTAVDDDTQTIVDTSTIGDVTPDEDTWELWEVDESGISYANVTYTGGWDSDTLPRTLVLAIVRTAKQYLTGDAQAGIKSASVGDASVVYARPTDAELPPGIWSSIRRYRSKSYVPSPTG